MHSCLMAPSRRTLLLLLCASALTTAAIAAAVVIRNNREKGRRRRREAVLDRLCRRRLATLTQYGREAGPGRVDLVQDVDAWNRCQAPLEKVLLHVDATSSFPPVLGFDCEWVTPRSGPTRPVAMVQLATRTGWCILVRTCKLSADEGGGQLLPPSLSAILSDARILKLGVGIQDDSAKCLSDLGVPVAGAVDLRHLLKHVGKKVRKTGLAGLSKAFLGVDLDKDWKIRAGNWEADELSVRQLEYAANDALAAVNVGLAMAAEIAGHNIRLPDDDDDEEEEEVVALSELTKILYDICSPFADVPFKGKAPKNQKGEDEVQHQGSSVRPRKAAPLSTRKQKAKSLSVRQSPLYHNAKLEAPDGQALCVCDQNKAEWYVAKGLGDKVCDDPFTVRLRFEPAGRPEGLAGEYYLKVKSNQCVVCGREESYLRKYVVPHEYRKHFPEVMRDHSSHDVLLMCHHCHVQSNLMDLNLRQCCQIF